MKLARSDLEAVPVHELWPTVSTQTRIEALSLSTREVAGYPALMHRRIDTLRGQGLSLERVLKILEPSRTTGRAQAFFERLG